MVHEAYVDRVRAVMEGRRERLLSLRGAGDARRYVKDVRSAIRASFGTFPARTPLRARVTGRIDGKGFCVEKVLFESRPGFVVSANLYLPARVDGPLPAVLGLCGHSDDGKEYPPYQSFCQALALKGFLALMPDPIGQGERRLFYPSDGRPLPRLCPGHNIVGNQMSLLGEFFGSWRAWDAVRSLDYLLSRPEADRGRVGVTGNSGGGTLTSYVMALDPRVTMAAPGCFICSYLANLENEVPSDTEQNPPGILKAGLDQADLLIAGAPRPTLLLSQYDDFFDTRYARAAAGDVDRIHRLLGSRGTARFFAGPGGHGFSRENREAMVGFFQEFAGLPVDPEERGVEPLDGRTLRAAPGGDVARAGSVRLAELLAEAARTAPADRRTARPDLGARVRRALRMPRISGVPHHRNLLNYGGTEDASPRRFQYAVETAPGIQCILTTFGPKHPRMHPPTGRIGLYVGNADGAAEALSDPAVRRLFAGGRPLVAVDPRGMGQSMPCTCGSRRFFEPYGADFLYASTAEMLSESILGLRVYDVLRSMDLLHSQGADEIELIGKGMGSVIAALAALLHPTKPRVTLLDHLPSFRTLLESPIMLWPLSALPRGALRSFDLPEVYAALGSRLRKGPSLDARMKPRRRGPAKTRHAKGH